MPGRRIATCATLAALAACSRPVLYYPVDPEPVVAASGSAAASTASTTTTSAKKSPTAATARPTLILPPLTAASDSSTAAMTDEEYLRARNLVVPVAGADMSKVHDSFNEGRSGHRTHRALDIMAKRGTPILAADDGTILRMSTNALGGISMYTVDPLGRIVYYYAHMDHYNKAMSAGRVISRGDTLGFVGTTGNAPKNLPHLHFQVMRWPADGKYWNGEPIDPFTYLGGGQSSTPSGARPFDR